jgi:hypothetical protein
MEIHKTLIFDRLKIKYNNIVFKETGSEVFKKKF